MVMAPTDEKPEKLEKCSSLEECFKRAFEVIINEDTIEIRKELRVAWPKEYKGVKFRIKVEGVVRLIGSSPNPNGGEQQWKTVKSRIVKRGLKTESRATVGIKFKTRIIRVDWGKPGQPGKAKGVHGLHVNARAKKSTLFMSARKIRRAQMNYLCLSPISLNYRDLDQRRSP